MKSAFEKTLTFLMAAMAAIFVAIGVSSVLSPARAESGDCENMNVVDKSGAQLAYSTGLQLYPKTPRKAADCYRKAAKFGLSRAQYTLGKIYEKGRGVVADPREAYIWYLIAQASGSSAAGRSLSKPSWRSHLTLDEIKSARREAARRMGSETNYVREESKVEIRLPSPETETAKHVYENAWQSVVVVRNGNGQGSGVIIGPNLVATNCHVVDGIGEIVVYKSQEYQVEANDVFYAKIIRADLDRDFCLLEVDKLWGYPADIRTRESLEVGDDVYGISAPNGLGLSLTKGLISQFRNFDGTTHIQTDAAISPGSSGGGLFDNNGKLIGIITSKIVDKEVEGIGFAIPADIAFE